MSSECKTFPYLFKMVLLKDGTFEWARRKTLLCWSFTFLSLFSRLNCCSSSYCAKAAEAKESLKSHDTTSARQKARVRMSQGSGSRARAKVWQAFKGANWPELFKAPLDYASQLGPGFSKKDQSWLEDYKSSDYGIIYWPTIKTFAWGVDEWLEG